LSDWLNSIKPATRGAILLICGISVFGFSDNLTLLVSDLVGVGQFHFSRSIFAIILVAILGRFLGISVLPRYWKPILVRTAFMVTAILLYFGVMPMMPIAEAGAGLFTSPIFVLIFSVIWFKERIGLRRIIAVIMGACGVMLVFKPGSDGFSPYHILPVMAGACYAMGSIVTFRYLRDESPLAILMCFIVSIGICGGLAASALTVFPVSTAVVEQAPFLFKGWQTVNNMYWVWMFIIAFGASVALSLMTQAYQLAETSYLAVYEYTYLISVGFFGWLFWGSVPGFWGFIGIILIIFAGIIIIVAQQQSDEKSN